MPYVQDGHVTALGGLPAGRVDARHADYLENQIRRGGLILWVRTDTEEKEKKRSRS